MPLVPCLMLLMTHQPIFISPGAWINVHHSLTHHYYQLVGMRSSCEYFINNIDI